MIAQLSEGSDAQLADTGLTTFSGIGLDYHKLHDPERTWGDPLQMESALVNTSCP
ncbi:MAG: hypothetical protein GWP15_04035, partial [Nitrospirae bacterium]|nr:hypothetical protein [Nitrospirota bacterium]